MAALFLSPSNKVLYLQEAKTFGMVWSAESAVAVFLFFEYLQICFWVAVPLTDGEQISKWEHSGTHHFNGTLSVLHSLTDSGRFKKYHCTFTPPRGARE